MKKNGESSPRGFMKRTDQAVAPNYFQAWKPVVIFGSTDGLHHIPAQKTFINQIIGHSFLPDERGGLTA